MSDTAVTLDGSSGPPSDGFVAPSSPKKPWHAPMIIASTQAQEAEKPTFTQELSNTVETSQKFGPSS